MLSGPSGIGKTTLTKQLADHLGGQAFVEPTEENPYLRRYYNGEIGACYGMQIQFLASRFSAGIKIAEEIRLGKGPVIQDRCLFDDMLVFAHLQYRIGHMDEFRYHTCCKIYASIVDVIPKPDIILILKDDTTKMLQRIKDRGNDYEQKITIWNLNYQERFYQTPFKVALKKIHPPIPYKKIDLTNNLV